MSTEEILRLIFSFLGGGVVVGIMNWLKAIHSDKITRKVEYLTKQITNLYGPLYSFTSQNKQLFDLYRKLHGAYTKEYVQKNWPEDERTQKAIREEAMKTIDTANKYIEVVRSNNDRVVDIITSNFAYIDQDDIEIFNEFILDHTRLKTEINEDGKMDTPLMIYMHIEEISYMRPQFIKRVMQKFHAKVGELKGYQVS
jgi:hypothetical protein